MSRAGDHRFRRVAQFRHGLLRAGQTFGIKRDGRVVKDALNDSRHPALQTTRDGTTLREFGVTCAIPIVARPSGACR